MAEFCLSMFENRTTTLENTSDNASFDMPNQFNSYAECVTSIYELRGHQDQVRRVTFYFLAFIIPIGLILNLLSGVVFLCSRLRKSQATVYFLALACADSMVLIAELLKWLNSHDSKNFIIGMKFMHKAAGLCKFINFLRYFGWLLSAWLVVTICIQRFITVAYPLRVIWLSTKTKSLLVLGWWVFVCAALASPAIFYFDSNSLSDHPSCFVKASQIESYLVWVVITRIVGELAIPSVLVIIFTSLIIYKLIKVREVRYVATQGLHNDAENQSLQTTITLLTIAIAFLVLRAPYFIAYSIYVNSYLHQENIISNIARDITYILAVTNYAINFFLYIISGTTFRKEFMRTFDWKCCKFVRARLPYTINNTTQTKNSAMTLV